MVVNLEDTIALTHNYVSTSNLRDCLRFLREKVDQISGVRDRAGGSGGAYSYIPPEEVFKVFTERLVEHRVLTASYLSHADRQTSSSGAVLTKRRRVDNRDRDNSNNTNSNEDFVFNFY